MTAIGGRPVQAAMPPEEAAQARGGPRAPAAKTPEMTVPLPNAKPVKATPAPTVKQAPDEARGRTPTKGAQPASGSAIADTGVRGQGFGLSTGGGAGTGSSLDVAGDFCCPEYLATMIARIRAAWNQNQGARGTSVIRFTIQRDGSIADATIVKPSGTIDARHRGAARGPGHAHAAAAARRLSQSDADRAPQFRIPMTKSIIPGALAIALLAAWPHAQQPAQPPAAAAAERDRGHASPAKAAPPPRLAVPDFIALSTDAETVAMAKTIGQVLWDDLNFEREFAFIPRDVYASIPQATSFTDVPFDRWRELNADGLVIGTVQKVGTGVRVEMRLFNVRTRQVGLSAAVRRHRNARLFAHTISDEIHKSQRALNGVARTKLTFDSDRDGERMTGTVQNRSIKEIYIADYDGENQRRVTVGTDAEHRAALVARRPVDRLHVVPARRREHLHLEHLPGHARRGDQGRQGRRELAAGVVARRHAARLQLDARRQPGDLRRQPRRLGPAAADEQPEHRHHADLVAVGHADRVHLGSQRHAADLRRRRRRPEPREEDLRVVLRSARPGRRRRSTRSRSRRAAGRASTSRCSTWRPDVTKSLTFGEGTNESPAFSPNGRHIVFTSTRSGKTQVFTMARDGKNVRQITRAGNNDEPDWSK